MGARGRWLGGALAERPSEVFRRHVYVAPFYEEDVLALVERLGPDRVLFGSDYPHPEGLAEPAEFADLVAPLPADQVRQILRDNTASLLGLDPAPAG